MIADDYAAINAAIKPSTPPTADVPTEAEKARLDLDRLKDAYDELGGFGEQGF
jgi:hypothetical protein